MFDVSLSTPLTVIMVLIIAHGSSFQIHGVSCFQFPEDPGFKLMKKLDEWRSRGEVGRDTFSGGFRLLRSGNRFSKLFDIN